MNIYMKGPWYVDSLFIYAGDKPGMGSRRLIADCGSHGGLFELNQANARLIAAAPELFELLKRIAPGAYLTDEDRTDFVKLITKIEG